MTAFATWLFRNSMPRSIRPPVWSRGQVHGAGQSRREARSARPLGAAKRSRTDENPSRVESMQVWIERAGRDGSARVTLEVAVHHAAAEREEGRRKAKPL